MVVTPDWRQSDLVDACLCFFLTVQAECVLHLLDAVVMGRDLVVAGVETPLTRLFIRHAWSRYVMGRVVALQIGG